MVIATNKHLIFFKYVIFIYLNITQSKASFREPSANIKTQTIAFDYNCVTLTG